MANARGGNGGGGIVVSILKILAVLTALSTMIFPREVLRSVKDELLVGASTATTATTTAVDGSASSSSVSIVDDDEEEEEADSDEKKNKKKKLKPKKKKRYAIAMYVDSDDHVYGLYSILRRAVTTGMVNDGIEIAVAVSKHMTDAEDERLEAIERQKPSWIESKMSMIKDIRTEIESNRAAISASSSATTTTTNNDNNEMMDALLEKRDALFASKREITTEIREGRHIDAKLPKEELPEGNIAVRKLREWHRDGLIHTIYPINSNYIQDIVRYSGVWEGVFNKLFLFNLTEYDKIIRLDCDVLIRTNLMHWFEYDTPCAIQAHDEIEWNSGVMVITPNATVFDDMISRLPDVTRLDDDISSFDVDGPDGWNSGVGEQGVPLVVLHEQRRHHEQSVVGDEDDADGERDLRQHPRTPSPPVLLASTESSHPDGPFNDGETMVFGYLPDKSGPVRRLARVGRIRQRHRRKIRPPDSQLVPPTMPERNDDDDDDQRVRGIRGVAVTSPTPNERTNEPNEPKESLPEPLSTPTGKKRKKKKPGTVSGRAPRATDERTEHIFFESGRNSVVVESVEARTEKKRTRPNRRRSGRPLARSPVTDDRRCEPIAEAAGDGVRTRGGRSPAPKPPGCAREEGPTRRRGGGEGALSRESSRDFPAEERRRRIPPPASLPSFLPSRSVGRSGGLVGRRRKRAFRSGTRRRRRLGFRVDRREAASASRSMEREVRGGRRSLAGRSTDDDDKGLAEKSPVFFSESEIIYRWMVHGGEENSAGSQRKNRSVIRSIDRWWIVFFVKR
eukprot:CAMPEP_0197182058 /NCGR_PEP_ID=MMETSP1423-20130617/6151_1 /TAXON_ID=476441 /ORGANISM="Pseudo-nitzschia heimii, Strain UNC1101" /LENGTH=790 /DNA_ID=CAMNT_0042632427 /DNA_START=73 /DNA_END=2446 /DNA_ORIENTATION=+